MITIETPPITLTKKLVAVLSDKIEIGTALNTVAHMSLGMGASLGLDDSNLCDYVDKSGVHHPGISAYPYIILKGRPNKIREAIELAKEKNIRVINFTNTMTVGTYLEQLHRTKETENIGLEFYGAAFYGDIADLSEITKKFSLYR